MEYLSTTVELVIGFIALLIMTKLLGKSTLSQITPFDFISALILGELVGNAIYDQQAKLGIILFSVALWGLLIYIIEWLTQRFRGTRKILEGKPSVLIRNGHLDRQEMKKNKLDINQLQHLLREQKVFSIREVAYAIFETNGTVSVLSKSNYENPTKADLQVPPTAAYLPVTFINDGHVDWENLEKFGYNGEWLMNKLRKYGIEEYKDVFYFEWKEDEGEFIERM
ncbi:uncharacterized membrane protein YcaP (DUF421 family) [Geomicrobium halophilum]|uniref:Uncharacterized membrane protein YcaP (DUF421 family) n=1 Tax=Geomicrobium halophilum TaxID=549000 RepID=A0A841PLK5_9BACL|nr:DUF421 domain-containing protein [Geomicrobium halophilum]MBB6449639.1 uncharacterized membrane protein YcaP (DUF421 family) [Geomicrobium halophilum]